MVGQQIRTVFFGTPVFAVPILEALIVDKEIEVTAVVTQPDRPAGRKQEVTPSPVKVLAKIHKIPVLTPEKLDRGFAKKITGADVAVLAAYGAIIPKEVLEIPKWGFLNVHPSLLPKYRGAAPVAAAILAGDKKTGVSVMLMDEGLDRGPVVAQWEEKIRLDDTRARLCFRLFDQAAGELPRIVKFCCLGLSKTQTMNQARLLNFTAKGSCVRKITLYSPPLPQDHSQASYAKKLRREHGFFPWEAVRAALEGRNYSIEKLKLVEAFEGLGKLTIAQLIERAMRALDPWPGVYTVVKRGAGSKKQKNGVKKLRLKLLRGHLEKSKVCLVIDRVQLEGKKPVSWKEWLRGRAEVRGEFPSSLGL